jgi:hypothetical protein
LYGNFLVWIWLNYKFLKVEINLYKICSLRSLRERIQRQNERRDLVFTLDSRWYSTALLSSSRSCLYPSFRVILSSLDVSNRIFMFWYALMKAPGRWLICRYKYLLVTLFLKFVLLCFVSALNHERCKTNKRISL